MKFSKEQRVTVPGTDAQAVIVDATETVPDFPIYTLRWLDEAGETHIELAERDVAAINADAEFRLAVEAAVGRRLAEIKREGRKADRKVARMRKASRKAKR